MKISRVPRGSYCTYSASLAKSGGV